MLDFTKQFQCDHCGNMFDNIEKKHEAYGVEACEECHANCEHDCVECGYCNDCLEHLDYCYD